MFVLVKSALCNVYALLLCAQRAVLVCAMATADARWVIMAGTAFVSWAGGEQAATHQWRRPAVTARTMTEVQTQTTRCLDIYYEDLTVFAWVSSSILFLLLTLELFTMPVLLSVCH